MLLLKGNIKNKHPWQMCFRLRLSVSIPLAKLPAEAYNSAYGQKYKKPLPA